VVHAGCHSTANLLVDAQEFKAPLARPRKQGYAIEERE
jgi:hypothetical protein